MTPQDLAETLRALARRHQVPGAQLAVYRDGEVVTAEVGELEFGRGRPVTADTAFPAGSVTKAFTATVAMILAADGDLDLAAPVGDYLPELSDLGGECTVEQVLSHTAGLPADPATELPATISRRRYVQAYCQRRLLLQPPGAGFSYSNLGYVLVGHLIEAVTGMDWAQATESILLRPLGIEPVFTDSGEPAGRPVASGHSVRTQVRRIRPVQQPVEPVEAPAGGLAVSAADLLALALLHVAPGRPDLLPAGWAERMRRPMPGAEPFGLADGWGLGLELFRPGSVDWFGHDGNGTGTACYFRVDPAGGRAVALTTNGSTGFDLWPDLLDELAGTGMPISPYRPPSSSCSVAAPTGCLGSYVNGDVEYRVSAAGSGLLRISVDGNRFDGIALRTDLTFAIPDPDAPGRSLTGRFCRAAGDFVAIQTGGRLFRRAVARGDQRRLTA